VPLCERVFVIGASAGGVEALISLVQQLPADFSGSLFVVLHTTPGGLSALPTILSRNGRLTAVHPTDQTPIEPRHIYVAPPDFHLMLEPGKIRLMRGPRENGFRPAADVLFRTAALAYRERVVGIVLSGTLDDGTLGLQIIKSVGGTTIVQDPETAAFPGMPRNALEYVDVDHCLDIPDLADLIIGLARSPVTAAAPADTILHNTGERSTTGETMRPHMEIGVTFSCPECGGVMSEDRTGGITHYRCRVGHAYSENTLLTEQNGILEQALWTALRVLEERVRLCQRLIERSRERDNHLVLSRFQEQMTDAQEHAEAIRAVLLSGQAPVPEGVSNLDTVGDTRADQMRRDESAG
jgi:two-component system, chemotaxis family, protein-glutamate methylesterase/glutaminase